MVSSKPVTKPSFQKTTRGSLGRDAKSKDVEVWGHSGGERINTRTKRLGE